MNTALVRCFLNYRLIVKHSRKSCEENQRYQLSALTKVLDWARKNVPYYQRAWADLKMEPFRTWEDFRELPLLSKQEVRLQTPESFLPEKNRPQGLWKSQTTGSSGIPITIYRSADTDSWTKALVYYSFTPAGVKLTDRFCQVLSVAPEKPQPKGFAARIGIKRYFPVSLKLPEEEISKQICALRPDVLYSFPSVLLRLADYFRRKNITLPLKCLFAQGEVLPETWRLKIEEAFKTRLYHTYGATEFPRIGFECRYQNGYHLLPHAAVVEVLREDGSPCEPGEEGEIVLTHLNNFTMPFIRYRIGDKGILSPSQCPCGISYPLLQHVTGRMDDFVILPDGRHLSARALTHIELEGILQHKIIQKSPSEFEVLVIPSRAFSEETVTAIQNEIKHSCGNEHLHVTVRKVDALPLSRMGKFQLVTREFEESQSLT